MSQRMSLKTEHAGAKNGGGFWGRRVEAKAISRGLRRRRAKADIANAMREKP